MLFLSIHRFLLHEYVNLSDSQIYVNWILLQLYWIKYILIPRCCRAASLVSLNAFREIVILTSIYLALLSGVTIFYP